MQNDEMTTEDQSVIITTHPDYSLIFYDGREVEIEGSVMESSTKKSIYANKIRCTGNEAEEEVKVERQVLMSHIHSYTQEIFEKSGYTGNVEVDEISFVNEKVVYITFVPLAEEKTDVIMLMEFEREGDGYTEEMLAQYEFDEEGRVLAAGYNEYSGQPTTTYEYDREAEAWVLAW